MRDKDDTQDIIAHLPAIRTPPLLVFKEIYTTTEASLFLGVKRSYLYELVRNRKIMHYKSCGGKLTYFRRQDLEDWMTYNIVPVKSSKRM